MASQSNRRRAGLGLHLVAGLVVLGVPLAVACGGKVESQSTGGGGSSTSKGSPSSSTSGSASATASTVPAPHPPAICDSQGLSTLEGKSCAVSFTQEIFPKYVAASGTWACADSNCHGPATSGGGSANAPTIGDDARSAYVALAQYIYNGAPYVDACSFDPNASAIVGNLQGSLQPKMPTSGGGVSAPGATDQEIADLKSWLSCGAPFN